MLTKPPLPPLLTRQTRGLPCKNCNDDRLPHVPRNSAFFNRLMRDRPFQQIEETLIMSW
jgi:hypothetical protein